MRRVLQGNAGVGRKNQQTEVSETTEFYLVNLLHDSVRVENVFCTDGPNKDEPLTQKLDRALNADYYEKIKRFKEFGDFTLFISGFFPDSLERKLVDVDYYMVMGGIAYNNLSLIMKNKAHGEVFSPSTVNYRKNLSLLPIC